MTSLSLPDRANLTQLRKQVRDLQRAVRAGSAPALAEVAEHHPAGAPDAAAAAGFPLHAARLVVSRRYGFSSWTRLKRYVETLEHYTRIPPGDQGAATPSGDLGDEFLRLACLWYDDDQPERWAMADRLRLLARYGVDITSRRADGLTPAQRALTTGHAELLGVLAEFGVPRPELAPADAMLAGDRAAAARLADENPGSLEQVKTARPGLIVWAAVLGRTAAVELLARLGFDVNAKARTDGPGTTEWETALHHTAGAGNLALARRLIELGADPGLRDQRFSSTPLGWAHHFGQPELIAFLNPLTSPEEPG